MGLSKIESRDKGIHVVIYRVYYGGSGVAHTDRAEDHSAAPESHSPQQRHLQHQVFHLPAIDRPYQHLGDQNLRQLLGKI